MTFSSPSAWLRHLNSSTTYDFLGLLIVTHRIANDIFSEMYDLISYTSGSDRHNYTISFRNGTNGGNMI